MEAECLCDVLTKLTCEIGIYDNKLQNNIPVLGLFHTCMYQKRISLFEKGTLKHIDHY